MKKNMLIGFLFLGALPAFGQDMETIVEEKSSPWVEISAAVPATPARRERRTSPTPAPAKPAATAATPAPRKPAAVATPPAAVPRSDEGGFRNTNRKVGRFKKSN